MAFFDFLDDPFVQAALAGTAIAATGGAAAPAVLGAEAATAGAGGLLAAEGAAAAAPAVLGAEGVGAGMSALDAGMGVMPTGNIGASGGLLGDMKGFASAVKPYGDAAGAAMQVKGLLSSPQQQHPQAQSSAPQMNNSQGAQTLAQLYQQGAQMSPEEQARLQRKTMWG